MIPTAPAHRTLDPWPALRAMGLVLLTACGGGGGGGMPSVTPPTAAFTATAPTAPVGQTVAFTDASTGSPTAWAWTFGDGAASSQQHPSHAWTTAGSYTVTLTVSNAGGATSATRTVAVTAPAPTAAFTFSPASPSVGQTVTFSDASTGSPTAWAWTFGDGSSSSTRNPTHPFTAAGAYSVALTATGPGGSNTATQTVTVLPVVPSTFDGSVVLGSPTATSVKVNVFCPTKSGAVTLEVGTAAGIYARQTPAVPLAAGTPVELKLDGLDADTRYHYRLRYTGPSGLVLGEDCSFHTARPPGSTFVFTVQADSHMDENSDLDTYLRTLDNLKAEGSDFHVDLGDTFMCEKHAVPFSGSSPPAASAAEVEARYQGERARFGRVSSSLPLMLVNGNHEGEGGWIIDGTAQNLAVWTAQSRLRHYPAPFPDGFYTGDGVSEPHLGQRGAWYSWTWGDALFVVLDPFWYTRTKPGTADAWVLTLGDRQYAWLRDTLAASRATFKFVFIHNLVGGLDGQMRGGVEGAAFFEWGGRALDGTNVFATKRPGWELPIHALLVRHGVTAVFHGHDHLYAKQDLDGIVYQEVPQPSAKNFQSGPGLAAAYHYASGTILSSSGHLRVTVAPNKVTAEYVRAWLPSQENATHRNGQVDDTWTVSARAGKE